MAVVVPGAAVKRDAVQDRSLGARVGEADVAERRRRRLETGLRWPLPDLRGAVAVGRTVTAVGVKDGSDPLGAHGGPGAGHQHVHGHHDGQQNLQDVGDERRQGAELHLAGLDPVAAEPDNGHRGKVHHDHDQRQHPGDQQRGLQVVARQPVVCLPAKRRISWSCRTKARMTLAPMICSRRTSPVRSRRSWPVPVQRHEAADDEVHDGQQHRHNDDDHRGERHVLLQRQDNAARAHDRCRDEHGEHQHREGLDLLGVVGGPGDEALRARTPATSWEDSDWILPKISGRSWRPSFMATTAPRYPAAMAAAAWTAAMRGHDRAEPENHRGVAGDDAVVDDGGVDGGQQEVARGLDQLQEDDGRDTELCGRQAAGSSNRKAPHLQQSSGGRSGAG